MNVAQILAQIRATPEGYRRAELWEKIERDYGKGFAKTLREQMKAEPANERRPQPKRRR